MISTSIPVPIPLGEAGPAEVRGSKAMLRTLPAAAYTKPDVLAWELDALFAGGWVCAGRAAAMPDPGDQRAVSVAGEGLLLVRGADSVLRGFFNVCRHRAHELLACGESAHHNYVRCPYHAWAYRLDGGLRATPNFDDLPADDPVRTGLVPVRVAEWQGWLFANLGGEAPGITSFVDDLDPMVSPYQPRDLVLVERHDYDVQANWKVIVENYHECLHCPSIHPQLVKLSPSDSGMTCEPQGMWVGGTMDLRDRAETMSLTGRGGRALPGLGAAGLREVVYAGLFPNLLLSLHPDYVMTHRLEPLTADRTHVECEWLSLPENRDDGSLEAAVDFWEVTNRQDWAACESVQRGIGSRAFRPGPLGYEESAVTQFVRMMLAGYRAGAPVPPA